MKIISGNPPTRASQTFNANSLAMEHCRTAAELEDAGRYDDAVSTLGEFWKGVGVRPVVGGLEPAVAAEVLHRVGTLSGWLGSFRRLPDAQENAKNLISEAAEIFRTEGLSSKNAEACISLSTCYWREGALDEARVILGEVLKNISGKDTEQEARALVGLAMVERRATRYKDALAYLQKAAPLFDRLESHARKASFHLQLGTVLENLGRSESNSDYIDRALLEYAAASFHSEEAGNTGFRASVENNLGYLNYTINRYAEAYEHLDRARRLFESSGDRGARLAQVEDTLARVMIAEGRLDEAETTARTAVRRLEGGGHYSLLAESLITHGTATARLGSYKQAKVVFLRAEEVAEQSGDLERAGSAALALLEELAVYLPKKEAAAIFERADDFLARSQDNELTLRLRRCARRLISETPSTKKGVANTEFVFVSEKAEEVLRNARAVACAAGPVIIFGETGTGKESLARLIHGWSERTGRFVVIRCAGLSELLFEQKLFGGPRDNSHHEDFDSHSALTEVAHGTLFIDEVSALSLPGQAALLRFINLASADGESDDSASVRIIAATNADLEKLVSEGQFRADLFYRLKKFVVNIPPLRERPSDIAPLAEHFIRQTLEANPGLSNVFTPEAISAFRFLPFRGNARELKSLIERTLLTAGEGEEVTAEMIEAAALRERGTATLTDPWENFSFKDEIHRVERRYIELALRDADGMVSRASKLLGFKHHESLASLLKTRHRDLLSARTPAKPRRRSIIRKDAD